MIRNMLYHEGQGMEVDLPKGIIDKRNQGDRSKKERLMEGLYCGHHHPCDS